MHLACFQPVFSCLLFILLTYGISMFHFCVLNFSYQMDHSYQYFQQASTISILSKQETPAPQLLPVFPLTAELETTTDMSFLPVTPQPSPTASAATRHHSSLAKVTAAAPVQIQRMPVGLRTVTPHCGVQRRGPHPALP